MGASKLGRLAVTANSDCAQCKRALYHGAVESVCTNTGRKVLFRETVRSSDLTIFSRSNTHTWACALSVHTGFGAFFARECFWCKPNRPGRLVSSGQGFAARGAARLFCSAVLALSRVTRHLTARKRAVGWRGTVQSQTCHLLSRPFRRSSSCTSALLPMPSRISRHGSWRHSRLS